MNLFKNKMIVVFIAGAFVSSCNKQLDIPSRNSVDAAVALTNKGGLEAAINSTYSVLKGLRHYGRDMFSVPAAMSDIAFANGRSSRLISENNNTANLAHWTTSYGVINEINTNLDIIPNIADATAADKSRYEGELKFLRALYYFDLVKSYSYIPTFVVANQDRGGVVINLKGFTSAADAVAYKPSRASIAETYEQIMSDLYASIALLSNSNRGRNYASKHAALALGSRIALYEGKWARADSFATAAITLTGGIGSLTNAAGYVAGWRAADHPEGIFQVFFATAAEANTQNEALSATHTTLAKQNIGIENTAKVTVTREGQGDLVPNAFLLNQMGISGFPSGLAASASGTPPTLPTLTYSNDIRNKLFEWGANSGGHYVEITKWHGKSGAPQHDNVAVLRWAELYLNRAEARYHLNNMTGAYADLNVIRSNRYVGFTAPTNPDFSGQALLDEILRQRMLELAFEGHRFFDLKRYGKDIIKTSPVVNRPATDFRILPSIPTSNIDGNPNMQQNFGY